MLVVVVVGTLDEGEERRGCFDGRGDVDIERGRRSIFALVYVLVLGLVPRRRRRAIEKKRVSVFLFADARQSRSFVQPRRVTRPRVE